MSAQPENVLAADNAGEKPVREQLSKATIEAGAKATNEAALTEDVLAETGEQSNGLQNGNTTTHHEMSDRGRPTRKRSFDETEEIGDAGAKRAPSARLPRKRSRENPSEPGSTRVSGEHIRDQLNDTVNGSTTTDELEQNEKGPSPKAEAAEAQPSEGSPRTKRSKLEETHANGTAPTEDKDVTTTALTEDNTAPEVGKQTEVAETKPASGGFSNTSASSPFATLSGPKASTQAQPSDSAFKSSGFGALSGSSSSGFGSLGKTGGLSSFASPAPKPEDKVEATIKPATSTFGGTLGATSAFSAKTGTSFGSGSGFGGFGGSGFGGGSKLSSFASPAGSGLSGSSKPVRAFGAPADDDDDAEEEDGEDGDDKEAATKSPKAEEENEKDGRFFERDGKFTHTMGQGTLANTHSVETGEEGETVEYTCRAKLYNYVPSDPSKPESKKEWKERGLGVLRLNVKFPESSDDTEDVESGASSSKPKARLVMRSDGSHRVILNTPVRKELSFGDVTGNEPKGQYVYFMGTVNVGEGGKLELLQLKMRHEFAVKLWEAVKSLQETM
ncbi:hypothetical protein MBLNU457_4803t1 [Dothideomycetes sp. NU457]